MSDGTDKDAPWTIERVLSWAADDFRARKIASPRLDAEVLLAHALGATRIQLVMDAKRPLSPGELARFRESVKRRRTLEPVAYVVGEREFYGHTFKVDRRVLVPRPDTETLVDVALERTRHASMSLLAADLCTGSGCVAIAIARARPTARVFATDLSPDAAAVARENAARLGAQNVAVAVGDLFAPLAAFAGAWDGDPGKPLAFDLVTANPPYVPASDIPGLMADVRDFEPRLALDGGERGLEVLKRLIAEAPAHLAPGGVLAVEIGAGEAEAVRELFGAAGFSELETARDYGRVERVVSGRMGR